jgi:hypothetical protein
LIHLPDRGLAQAHGGELLGKTIILETQQQRFVSAYDVLEVGRDEEFAFLVSNYLNILLPRCEEVLHDTLLTKVLVAFLLHAPSLVFKETLNLSKNIWEDHEDVEFIKELLPCERGELMPP